MSKNQLESRQQRIGTLGYTANNNNFDIPSYFRNIFLPFINSLVIQYNVDESIVGYNLNRMWECFNMFADERIRRHKYNPEIFTMSDKQKKYALEFYLQIDGMIYFNNRKNFFFFFFSFYDSF